MRPFRVILVEQEEDRTTTFIVPFERTPDLGSVVELPHGQTVVVRDILSSGSYGTVGTVIAVSA